MSETRCTKCRIDGPQCRDCDYRDRDDELVRLRAEIARLTKERDARPDISREDARIWSAHPDELAFADNTEIHAALRINAALRSHAKGVKP